MLVSDMLDRFIFKEVKGAWDDPYKIGDRTYANSMIEPL